MDFLSKKDLIRIYKKDVQEILEEQTELLRRLTKLEEDKKKRLQWIKELEKLIRGKEKNEVTQIVS